MPLFHPSPAIFLPLAPLLIRLLPTEYYHQKSASKQAVREGECGPGPEGGAALPPCRNRMHARAGNAQAEPPKASRQLEFGSEEPFAGPG